MKWVTACAPGHRPDRLPLADRPVHRPGCGVSVRGTGWVRAVAEETGAIPYDVPGVELSHVGDGCSFDSFLEKYQLDDPALQEVAVIVRGADTDRFGSGSAGGWTVCNLAWSAPNSRRPRDAAGRHRDLRRTL